MVHGTNKNFVDQMHTKHEGEVYDVSLSFKPTAVLLYIFQRNQNVIVLMVGCSAVILSPSSF